MSALASKPRQCRSVGDALAKRSVVGSASLLPTLNDSNAADPTRPHIPTIGDRLDAGNVSWMSMAADGIT